MRLPLARLRHQEARYGWRESAGIGWSGFRGEARAAAAQAAIDRIEEMSVRDDAPQTCSTR